MSLLVNHIATYGNYGLGMTKEWGLRKGLNPVIYFNRNSYLANQFSVLTTRPTPAFSQIMGYMKPYEGNLYRGGEIKKEDVRFYDEHEWRYVPDSSIMVDNHIGLFLQHHAYMNPEELANANRKLEAESTRLSFSADDVKYIIVEDENQIVNMIKNLRNIKERRYDIGRR